jgi:hypothetical protein
MPGITDAESQLLFTDDEQVFRHGRPLQNTVEPDHLLIAIGYGG